MINKTECRLAGECEQSIYIYCEAQRLPRHSPVLFIHNNNNNNSDNNNYFQTNNIHTLYNN